MILVTTEYSPTYKSLMERPISTRPELILTQESVLSIRPSVYGKVTNIIYVYGEFSAVRKLGLSKHSGDVVFVCDVTLFNAFSRYMQLNGFDILTEPMDKTQKQMYVEHYYRCSSGVAKYLCEYFSYNLRTLQKSEEAVFGYLRLGKPLNVQIDLICVSYTDALYYLCGDPKSSREKFLAVISKYRYSGKHIVSFIRKHLQLYIELYFNELKKLPDIQEYQICIHLMEFLNIERALSLYHSLEKCTCCDLLRVV